MAGIKAKLGNLLKLNISEELYLIGIALVFLAISLFLGLEIWVVHNSFFEYTVWTDVFSSSIFLVLTILLLSWLLKVREIREWHTVRDEVFFRIRLELSNLFDLATEYFEGGSSFKMELMEEKDKKKNMDMLVKGLEKLSNSDVVSSNLIVMDFFKNSWEMEDFQNADEKLANIQGLYSRHLPADITISLMKLQECIWTLDNLKKANDIFNKSTLISNLIASTAKDAYENNKVEMLKIPLVNLLKEIHVLYSIPELKFNYPPILS